MHVQRLREILDRSGSGSQHFISAYRADSLGLHNRLGFNKCGGTSRLSRAPPVGGGRKSTDSFQHVDDYHRRVKRIAFAQCGLHNLES